MGKRLFDGRVKELICKKMEELGAEITQEQVIEIIEPYVEDEINIAKLKESYKKTIAGLRASKNKVNKIFKQIAGQISMDELSRR